MEFPRESNKFIWKLEVVDAIEGLTTFVKEKTIESFSTYSLLKFLIVIVFHEIE